MIARECHSYYSMYVVLEYLAINKKLIEYCSTSSGFCQGTCNNSMQHWDEEHPSSASTLLHPNIQTINEQLEASGKTSSSLEPEIDGRRKEAAYQADSNRGMM
jgi:hypothetical protein